MKITVELDTKEFAELTAATVKSAKSSDNAQILQEQFELLSKVCKDGMCRFASPKDLPKITQAMLDLLPHLN